MSDATRRAVLIGGGVLVVVILVAALLVLTTGEDRPGDAAPTSTEPAAPLAATDVLGAYLSAFAAGRAEQAAGFTDDPAAARSTITAVWRGLAATSAVVTKAGTVDQPSATATEFTEEATVTWSLGAGREWSHPITLTLRRVDGAWRVHWSPASVHPKLGPGQTLVLATRKGRAAVVDRDGAPLLTWKDDRPTAEPGAVPLIAAAMGRIALELAGPGSWSVALADSGGRQLEVLHSAGSAGAGPLRATISVPVQRAAQAAVDAEPKAAAIIAIQPSTGELLAVAQNGAAGDDPKALQGLYPPGSTFKLATAVAALQSGVVTADTVLPCPAQVRIGGRTIPNADRFALGDVPLHTAFAQSCNTTFAAVAAGLDPAAIPNAAASLGLDADFDIPGINTELGGAQPAQSQAQRMEDAIGQGTVQASPLGVALMAATVASGRAVTPKLWRGFDTRVNTGYQPPPAAVLAALRPMMREVVTSGRGSDLARFGAVYGKTGTAQFGDGTNSHGWFAGYRGDLAFAVLVEDAGAAGPAVRAAGEFLAETG